jgi:(1->4)-alpha-D-glucan 1-alpha-D-glucosylmutase
MQERQARWPYALSTSSTHDTKRSEDMRARLNVLSELPEEWASCLSRWSRLNERLRLEVDDQRAPDANEEYLLYQTLLGAWPLEPYDDDEYGRFIQRVQTFMRKALHEAKVHTSWINPNPAYDEAVQQFIARILDPAQNSEFIDELRALQRRLSHYGLFNSLAQTLLKLTAPGVPDTYQGTELWDFSLTDPDNRRPVDFELRGKMLKELTTRFGAEDRRSLAEELTRMKTDGRIKMLVTSQSLRCRRENPGLFSKGDYLPLQLAGARQDHALAFMRRHEGRRALVVVPRLLTRLIPSVDQLPLDENVWQDTAVLVPDGGAFVNAFTGERIQALDRVLLAQALTSFPVALLLSQD